MKKETQKGYSGLLLTMALFISEGLKVVEKQIGDEISRSTEA